jgi:formyl-CoA transferase
MTDSLFAGLKIIDCASWIAGPAAATILSDFGADVIKIEPPGAGDPWRALTPIPGKPTDAYWQLTSRNKRSLALDLKQADGRAVLYRLLASADVFITNFPLPVRERLHIAPAQVLPLHPRLIYASFTAYGEVGADAAKTGFDSTAYWARTGLMDIVRATAETEPARSAPGMGDHPSATGLYAAIVTALYRREKTGQGGVMALHNEPRQWRGFLDAISRADLADDLRFATSAARKQHAGALVQVLDAVFAQRDLADWRTILDAAGVTFGGVQSVNETADDGQMQQIGALVPFADGAGLTVSSPFHLEGETKVAPRRAPAIGEHTDVILREAGYAPDEIQRLRALGVLA